MAIISFVRSLNITTILQSLLFSLLTIFPSYAAEEYEYVRMWPELPQPWYFAQPCGVAADSFGNVYVADTGNHRIQKFSSQGVFLTKWGTSGSGDGQFNWPNAVAADSFGNVYVADTRNDRIQKFSSQGVFLDKWGTTGSGDGQFVWPRAVAVDSFGDVYVADTGNDRVQKFSSQGVLLDQWFGGFDYPFDIAVSPDGDVYVLNSNSNIIQIFDSNGALIGKLEAIDGAIAIAVGGDGKVFVSVFDGHPRYFIIQSVRSRLVSRGIRQNMGPAHRFYRRMVDFDQPRQYWRRGHSPRYEIRRRNN